MELVKMPPMGWNSWDCYGASVTEEELLANAEYVAAHLKPYGWEYVVCDIQWYEPTADSSRYHKFAPLEMDGYSRLIPAVNRFPSAAGGVGFKKIADKIHDMGLKFGIHIMRGIPRQAVHQNCAIMGSRSTARDIAHPSSCCDWNTDMYGVDTSAEGAREYYDSLFSLYAGWGVDFVKVDDISQTRYTPEAPGAAKSEIKLIYEAIKRSGRDMVLSLSPGPARTEEASFLCQYANMWRMSGDYWDRWSDLYHMFELCNDWSGISREGHWPDCDMLPLGHIGIRAREHDFPDRMTQFTTEEQKTMMTLWCIFRSPLMFGGELRDNDEFTLSLLTNREILDMNRHGKNACQISRDEDICIWSSEGENGKRYLAFFNLNDREVSVKVDFDKLLIQETGELVGRNLWEKAEHRLCQGSELRLKAHGTMCFQY